MKSILRYAHPRSGFTLVEAMITIAVIGVVATLAAQGLPFIKEKTRDNVRQHALAGLQKAIEIYRNDNGSYPALPSGAGFVTFAIDNDSFAAGWSPLQVTPGYIPGLIPSYYRELPQEPLPGPSKDAGCQALGYNRNIVYVSNGQHYKLIYNCASETDDYPSDSRFYDPGRPVSAWAVASDMDHTTWALGW